MSTGNENTVLPPEESTDLPALPPQGEQETAAAPSGERGTLRIINNSNEDPDSMEHVPNEPDLENQEEVVSTTQETVDLPVATPLPPPAPELLERIRQLQAQAEARENPENIPHAVLQDVEAENRANRRIIMRFAGVALLVVALTAIILGVTFGRNSNSTSTSLDPTPSPTTQDVASLQELIISVSFDGGAALEDTDSPQYRAFDWLASNENLAEYQDWKRIQRYVLAVFYYTMNGDDWFENDGWLSDNEECTWFSQTSDRATPPSICNDDGHYAVIGLVKLNVAGGIPSEISLLSDSLCKYETTCVCG